MEIKDLIDRVNLSIGKALAGDSKLDQQTLSIGGFSTVIMRRFFNNVCDNTNYLEIGAFRGATACAAACNNNTNSYIVEDFSQPFGQNGVKEDLLSNIENVRAKTKSIQLIESNCWTLDKNIIQDIDVIFYDGSHDRESQAKALPHFFDCLNKHFIYIVDDTNWESVHTGCNDGFTLLKDKAKIEKEWRLRTPKNDSPDWHNGVDIFVCSKL